MSNATIRRSPVLVILVVLMAACSAGGGAATTGPATPAPATGAAATPAVATPAATTAAATPATATSDPATDPPSETTAPPPPSTGPVDVEALVPTEVGGITLTPQTIDIDEFLGAYEGFGPMLATLGKSPDDVTIVQAQGSNPTVEEIMVVQAFRVAGADPAALMNEFLEFWKVENDVATPITIADKPLIELGSSQTQAQYKTYYYGYGDTIFRLNYNGPNFDEQMAALVSALP